MLGLGVYVNAGYSFLDSFSWFSPFFMYTMHQSVDITLYVGHSLANQKSRKLRVLVGSWKDPIRNHIAILIDIRENEAIMFKE